MPSSAPETLTRAPLTRWLEALFLGFIVLGIACRFYGLNWDQGALLHPDERFVLDVIGKIGWPTSWGEWFDAARSPFNPANSKDVHYVYGQWPLLLGKLAFALAERFDYNAPVLVGRALSAFFDSLTIGLTFVVARRIFERQWALFAAALVALAALHVQQSHFFTVDNFAAFWMLASFWAATRWLDGARARAALACGACLGIALACKISAVFIAIPLLVLLALSARKHPVRQVLWGTLGCFILALICFRVFQPMAFRGEFGFFDFRLEPRFWNDIAYQAAITRGEVDVPFNVQWIGRAPWLFSARNLGFWGYGWSLLISGVAGALLTLGGVRDIRNRDEKTSILLASALFCVVLFGVQGATFSKFTRYFLPMTPLVALLAAHAWRRLAQLTQWRGAWRFGAPIVASSSALWCLAVTGIYGRTHTRIAASRWIVSHLAPGTRVANETPWDESLPLSWLAAGSGELPSQSLDSYALDSVEKREKMLQVLDESDWIFFSSGRSWQNIPRWPAKWPMTSRFYYALWNGDLGFERAREFTSYPRLGPLQFPDDNAEEALSVYDHPRVILWRKTPNYSAAKARQILEIAPLPTKREWQPRWAGKS